MSLMWVKGPKHLDRPLLHLQVHFFGTEWKEEQLGLESAPMWTAGVSDSSFICSVTSLAPAQGWLLQHSLLVFEVMASAAGSPLATEGPAQPRVSGRRPSWDPVFKDRWFTHQSSCGTPTDWSQVGLRSGAQSASNKPLTLGFPRFLWRDSS